MKVWIYCPECEGKGFVRKKIRRGNRWIVSRLKKDRTECGRCEGRGTVISIGKQYCPWCKGSTRQTPGGKKETCITCGGTGIISSSTRPSRPPDSAPTGDSTGDGEPNLSLTTDGQSRF